MAKMITIGQDIFSSPKILCKKLVFLEEVGFLVWMVLASDLVRVVLLVVIF